MLHLIRWLTGGGKVIIGTVLLRLWKSAFKSGAFSLPKSNQNSLTCHSRCSHGRLLIYRHLRWLSPSTYGGTAVKCSVEEYLGYSLPSPTLAFWGSIISVCFWRYCSIQLENPRGVVSKCLILFLRWYQPVRSPKSSVSKMNNNNCLVGHWRIKTRDILKLFALAPSLWIVLRGCNLGSCLLPKRHPSVQPFATHELLSVNRYVK